MFDEYSVRMIMASKELYEAAQQMIAAFEYNGTCLIGAEYVAKEKLKEILLFIDTGVRMNA